MPLTNAQKMKKIRDILDETPNVYPVHTFNGEQFVRVDNHQYLMEQMKAIAKVVGKRF